jgi:hypothetical protein
MLSSFTRSGVLPGVLLALALTAALTALPRAAHAQNLLTNGSFEGVAVGSPGLNPGSTTIMGWTVVTAEIAWIANGDFGIIASEGQRALDLSGYHDSFPYGGVTQDLSTFVGATYNLSFDLGSIVAGNNVSLRAAASSASQDFLFTRTGSGGEQQWGRFSLDFVATSTTTAITLTGLSSVTNNNIGLDNASVTLVSAAAPEPSALALLLPVLPLAGLVLRKGRQRKG